MRVFKFGGASVKDASAVENVHKIVQQYGQPQHLLIVVSAMGKTTNALEALLNNFWEHESIEDHLAQVHDYHEEIVLQLFKDKNHPIYDRLAQTFTELRLLLSKSSRENYNRLYDQVVSFGELISTIIVAEYLNINEQTCQWIDARKIIRTDATWREGKIDWKTTQQNVRKHLLPILSQKIVLTQGFIGGTAKGETTTLGREGSDFTAAIFANCLHAESQTIWKDVPGVLNADPKRVAEAQLFSQLSYQEASEMTYYGATVIHPKTIAPLHKKKIPLYVKSFLQPQKSGTCINSVQARKFIPAIMFKTKQVLVHISIKEFGFLSEECVAKVLQKFKEYESPVYLIHKTAFQIAVCTDNRPEKIEAIAQATKAEYSILLEEDLQLLTIKDADEGLINQLIPDREVLLEIKQGRFYQAVFR
jgi:aspartate kinase